jgi:hypothetical protein
VLLDGDEAEDLAGDRPLSEDELFERLKSEFDAEEFEPETGDPEEPKEATG